MYEGSPTILISKLKTNCKQLDARVFYDSCLSSTQKNPMNQKKHSQLRV